MKTYLKYIGLTLLGAVGLFLVFGLPIVIAYQFKATASSAPMFALAPMMLGMFGYLCYILGDALWSWKQGTIDQWGL